MRRANDGSFMWNFCDYFYTYLLFFLFFGSILSHLVGSWAGRKAKTKSDGIGIGIAVGFTVIIVE